MNKLAQQYERLLHRMPTNSLVQDYGISTALTIVTSVLLAQEH